MINFKQIQDDMNNGVIVCRSTMLAAIAQAVEMQERCEKPPELMRQAVATVVSRVGDDLRIGWLRPERCEVGTLLYCPTR